MLEETKMNVLEKLKNVEKDEVKRIIVTLLPDFFLDHIITVGDFDHEMNRMRRVYNHGGGNLIVENQLMTHGGNSANTAIALSRLGISTYFIGKTDEIGYHFMRMFMEKEGVNIDGVRTDGILSKTVSIEFNGKNVMLSDPGSLSNFSFEDLDENRLNKISSSDMLFIGNWVLNKRGTKLAEDCLNFAKKHKVRTFFDSGDPSSRRDEIDDLFNAVISNKNLDIVSMNENELKVFSNEDNITEGAGKLQNEIHARIDLHTSTFSMSKSVKIPSFDIKKRYISTGAGDAWNAGDIFGELLGFNDKERLLIANAVASYYISRFPPLYPKLKNLIDYLSIV